MLRIHGNKLGTYIYTEDIEQVRILLEETGYNGTVTINRNKYRMYCHVREKLDKYVAKYLKDNYKPLNQGKSIIINGFKGCLINDFEFTYKI